MRSSFSLQASSSMALPTLETPRSRSSSPVRRKTAQEKVDDAVRKQAALMADMKIPAGIEIDDELLGTAYERSGEVCAEYAKTFYLGTKLMTPERQRAIWAIYVWCRRTDELVDGPNASHITPTALDRWEQRLEDIFAGKPFDMLDAALTDTVQKFPVHIQPFRDMIDGMRMDLYKKRYETFQELYLYCYNVAGTVGLMSTPVMGIAPEFAGNEEAVREIYDDALALGIANQLTNILRDVGEDARRGRIYLPLEELSRFGVTEQDIFDGVVTDRWRSFMRWQLARARDYFEKAERGVRKLDKQSRWPVYASLVLYRQILDSIEKNDFDNFHKRAYVPKFKKLLSLPEAFVRSQLPMAAPRGLKVASNEVAK